MLSIKINQKALNGMADKMSKRVTRSLEKAIDNTARAIKAEVKKQIPVVFDRPTPYTINSLQVTLTQNHNMKASVWFKDPDRMMDHYLAPQVEGGPRKMKGFERALGAYFEPSKYAKLDRYGNMPYAQIVQILSVLGRAEYKSGYAANVTARSRKRNRRPRDYVQLKTQHGSLPPGIYQRVREGAAISGKAAKSLPFGEWQRGSKGSIVRATGLRPVLIQISKPSYRARLPFFSIAQSVHERMFPRLFQVEMEKG